MSGRFRNILDLVLRKFGPHVVSVTIFGSQVRGEARERSDYDLIVIMEELDANPNVREENVASAVADILLSSGIRISPLVLSREEATFEATNGSPLLASVLSNYEILHDPTGFMIELLDLTKRLRCNITYIERGQAWNLARTV